MELIAAMLLFAGLLMIVYGVINLFGDVDNKKAGMNWLIRGLATIGLILLVGSFLQ